MTADPNNVGTPIVCTLALSDILALSGMWQGFKTYQTQIMALQSVNETKLRSVHY